MEKVKPYLKMAGIAAAVLLSLFVLQCLVNLIPRSAIEENIMESLVEVEKSSSMNNRHRVIPGYYTATDDRAGDFAWMQVLYGADSKHPIKSAILMKRYVKYGRPHEELREQIENDLPPNDNYSRYWHGMTIFLRILLVFFSLSEIKFLLGSIICILWGLCFYKLGRFAPVLFTGFLLCGGIFSCLSVEYMAVFLITPIALLLITKLKEESLPTFFLLVGLITAYFDFLTAETLTLTLPLLYLVYKGVSVVKPFLCWCAGYVATMGIRIGIALAVVDFEFKTILKDKFVTEKVRTDHYDGLNSVMKNIRDLIPVPGITSRVLVPAVFVVLAAILYLVLLYWNKKTDRKKVSLYVLIGCIPVVRLALLNGHAYFHSEFTSRALMATVMSLIFILSETLYKYYKQKKGRKKPCKKKTNPNRARELWPFS